MRVIVDGVPREMRTVWWRAGGGIELIDQRLLPRKLAVHTAGTLTEVEEAIRTMTVRGAPAIGAAGAFGMVLAQREEVTPGEAAIRLAATRPTGRDLSVSVEEMRRAWEKGEDLLAAAQAFADRQVEECRAMGRHGEKLLKDGARMLTHCNAGALATVDVGTALAPVRAAHAAGRDLLVYVDETRPWLQGSRLTAWELLNEGIDHCIIADNAAGHLMQRGEIDIVITGADRIARSGDAANKIGTYTKAVVARENGVPFYVAAPVSTFDLSLESGASIPIEERREDEVLDFGGVRVAPEGSRARNPVFDVTPAKLIKGIITPFGVFPPARAAAEIAKRSRSPPAAGMRRKGR